MFGDLFSQRTNFESGLMYSSRRKFLVETGRTVFEPPPDLQPRQLARRRHAQALDNDLSLCNDEESSISSYSIDPKTGKHFDHGHFNAVPPARRRESNAVGMGVFLQQAKQSNAESEPSAAARRFRKTAKSVMGNNYYETAKEYNNKEGWVEESMAGVHYWVNKLTGEVSAENPFNVMMSPSQGTRKSITGMKNRRASSEVKFTSSVLEEEVEYGTGSLVFKDDVDVDELYRLLEDVDRKKKKRQ